MDVAKCFLRGISPYSQSKAHFTEKLPKEKADDYEDRTWRERLHVDEESGFVCIPPMAIKNCLSECAKYLSMQVVGKGKNTYTKHFEAGVLVDRPLCLGIKKEDVKGELLFVSSDGRRGGGTRVRKYFPYIAPNWSGSVQVYLLDGTVTQDVFTTHLEEAGNFIGLGRFRPRNNGFYGRFSVEKIEWSSQ